MQKQFKVIGPNTTNGQLSMWHYPSLESANQFAESLACQTHAKIMVCELIGTWQIKDAPVEFVSAVEPPPQPESEIPGAFIDGQSVTTEVLAKEIMDTLGQPASAPNIPPNAHCSVMELEAGQNVYLSWAWWTVERISLAEDATLRLVSMKDPTEFTMITLPRHVNVCIEERRKP